MEYKTNPRILELMVLPERQANHTELPSSDRAKQYSIAGVRLTAVRTTRSIELIYSQKDARSFGLCESAKVAKSPLQGFRVGNNNTLRVAALLL